MRTDDGDAERPDDDPFAPRCDRDDSPSIARVKFISGKGGIGGMFARRIGRCGELNFLDDGEPGNILEKLYDENRLEALRSSGSCRDKAANVDLVSAGTSVGSTEDSGGVTTSLVSIIIESEGRLRTGSNGANLGGLSGALSSSSSGNVDIRLGGVCPPGDRIGEFPVVISESIENRDIGLGFPKESRLNRSGLGGVGLTAAAGARVVGTEFEDTGTGGSVN